MTPESARDEMVTQGDEKTQHNAVQQLRCIAGLCNAGEFDAATIHLPLPERKINGDPTDQAILRFSESLGPVSNLKQLWKKEFELAFNSKNKFMIRTLSLVDKQGTSLALTAEEATAFTGNDMYVPSREFGLGSG